MSAPTVPPPALDAHGRGIYLALEQLAHPPSYWTRDSTTPVADLPLVVKLEDVRRILARSAQLSNGQP